MAKRTDREKKELLLQFVKLLGQGMDREEIEETLALAPGDYEPLLTRFYDQAESSFKSKSNLRIYLDYITRQAQFVRDLERCKLGLEKSNWKNAQGYVAAVKVQSEILDKLISQGQDLGLIKRIAERFVMIGGTDVRDMDLDSLNASIEAEILDVRKLQKGKLRKKKSKVLMFKSNVERSGS
ncbi:MAG: hypothetical protein KAS32_19590 [Candidatus Peribacteraceae bacterium]|nr:hypothetical protein [Candidatus Peribacteraceae bacterium]